MEFIYTQFFNTLFVYLSTEKLKDDKSTEILLSTPYYVEVGEGGGIKLIFHKEPTKLQQNVLREKVNLLR